MRPDLKAQKHPLRSARAMLRQVEQAIKQVRWTGKISRVFWLLLERTQAAYIFRCADRPLSQAKFKQAVQTRGWRLDLKRPDAVPCRLEFMNGERIMWMNAVMLVTQLADERALPASATSRRNQPSCFTSGIWSYISRSEPE